MPYVPSAVHRSGPDSCRRSLTDLFIDHVGGRTVIVAGLNATGQRLDLPGRQQQEIRRSRTNAPVDGRRHQTDATGPRMAHVQRDRLRRTASTVQLIACAVQDIQCRAARTGGCIRHERYAQRLQSPTGSGGHRFSDFGRGSRIRANNRSNRCRCFQPQGLPVRGIIRLFEHVGSDKGAGDLKGDRPCPVHPPMRRIDGDRASVSNVSPVRFQCAPSASGGPSGGFEK